MLLPMYVIADAGVLGFLAGGPHGALIGVAAALTMLVFASVVSAFLGATPPVVTSPRRRGR